MHQISFSFFQRGITPERETTQTRKKKNLCQLFVHEESIYEISKPYHARFIRYGMHVSNGCTDGQPETNKTEMTTVIKVFLSSFKMVLLQGNR